jgi:hypothetical protein
MATRALTLDGLEAMMARSLQAQAERMRVVYETVEKVRTARLWAEEYASFDDWLDRLPDEDFVLWYRANQGKPSPDFFDGQDPVRLQARVDAGKRIDSARVMYYRAAKPTAPVQGDLFGY